MSSFEVNTERKPSSFAHPSKQSKSSNRTVPLTRDFFSQLIKLETEFHNKTYTVTTLDELIQFYARAVEYYDKAKDEIAAYFIFKIQDVLATKKSLKMLLEQNVKPMDKRDSNSSMNEHNETRSSSLDKKSVQNSKPYVPENILEENSEDEDDREEKRQIQFQKKRKEARLTRKNRTSISTMKNQKQRFVNFFYKMETHKANEKQNMHVIITGFNATSEKNDLYVKRDIDNQKYTLRRRLERRDAKAFMSHTFNNNGSYPGQDNRKENEVMLENFLDGLDVDPLDDDVIPEESYHTDDQSSVSDRTSGLLSRKNMRFETEEDESEPNLSQQKIPTMRSPRGYFSPNPVFQKSNSKFSPNPVKDFKFGNE